MKSLLSAAALLLGSTFATMHADAQTAHWTFSYTGFYDAEAAQFLPDQRLDGAFTGFDANADGVLERAELTSLRIGALDYIACGASSNPNYYCGADTFSFSTNSGLAFSLGEYGGDPEGWAGGGRLITSGQMDYEYRYDPRSSSEHHLYWTDATTLNMASAAPIAASVPAIPEAPVWAMLLVGIGGIALLGRRDGQQIRNARPD